MKKITSLMLMLLCAVTTLWAGPTDLPQMSTDGDIKWYTIKNTRSGKYATFNGDAATMTQQATVGVNSFFYFTASAAETADGFTPVMVHNAGTDKKLSDWAEWTAEGKAWFISTTDNSQTAKGTGLHISNSAKYEGWNSWNDGGSSITYYMADDAGSIFLIYEANFETLIAEAKNAAKAKINNYAQLANVFTTSADAYIADIDAIETASFETFAEIDAIVANYINTVKDKYVTINTPARGNGYLQMTTLKVIGTASAATPANIWQFVNNNGSLNIYNPYTGLYMCATGGSSQNVAVTDNQANAGAYTFTINESATNAEAKVKIGVNGAYIHMDGYSNLVRWDNAAESEFTVTLVEDFSSIISNYKTSTIATLDQWATLTVVFDASLINGAKTAINAIKTNSFATFAAIDATLEEVTDAVAAKMFTFRNAATNARKDAYLTVNTSTGKGGGLHNFDYNAVWSLRHASGTSFYLYNELNSVYLANPADGGLTETPVAAYSFEIVDVETSKAELKCNGETLHLGNGLGLQNYDYDDPASRWIIECIDVTADIKTILEGLKEDDYADVPALGQYTTAAYEALSAASTSAKTVEEVEAAIAAFKKAKNRPVFTINGVISYAAGKSLYDDEDGRPNFKATNKYDRAMWWAFDQTTTTVGLTESVDVVNYATGRGFWGEKALRITETSDSNENDGIFLFYTVGNDNPLHYQDANQVITRYGDTASTSGSATTFTYVGNTYDLDKLTDDHISALSALQAAYDSKAGFANATIGNGLGQYSEGDVDAIKSAVDAVENILAATVAEQVALTVDYINEAATTLDECVATLKINLPDAGKYYRIQGACEASLKGYYITGHTNADGGRIALTAEADASTIYYFDGTNLIAYESGLVVGLNADHWTFASIDDNSKPASTITFAQSPRTTGAYTVKSANRYFHYTVYNGTVQVNRCTDDVCKEHDWYLTEVTELPVTVTAAGYATFYAPVAVELPADVTAHTVTINGEWATLSEAMTVIPANTGVVLVGEGSYNFAVTTAEAFNGENLMAGTIAKTLVTKPENTECYVLANGENGVGMYAAAIGTGENVDGTKFYNAGHKAYLVVEDASKAPASYSFRFGEGTTAIENVEVENTVKAIYDLTGRRVEAITAAGIYIVNGKKVLVK